MDLNKRKSPRIPDYNYAEVNYYFITLCTDQKKCLFHYRGQMNRFGEIAEACIKEIPSHYPGIRVDKYVVMPNHVHLILVVEAKNTAGAVTVIGTYKSSVSRKIHKLMPDLKIWQRSFHDHIIRNQKSYEMIWNYIDTNPMRWHADCFYSEEMTV